MNPTLVANIMTMHKYHYRYNNIPHHHRRINDATPLPCQCRILLAGLWYRTYTRCRHVSTNHPIPNPQPQPSPSPNPIHQHPPLGRTIGSRTGYSVGTWLGFRGPVRRIRHSVVGSNHAPECLNAEPSVSLLGATT